MSEDNSDELFIEGRGRSKQRRQALEISELAQRLADLEEAYIAKLPLSAELRGEVLVAHRTKGNTSRRRQIKYLAGLLRKDEDAVLAATGYLDGQQANPDDALYQLVERWREQLVAASGDTSQPPWTEIREQLPQLDVAALSRELKRFRELGDKIAFRRIFKLLRQAALEPR